MFKAITTTEKLEEFIGVGQTLVDESRIHLHNNTLRLAAADPANVALVEETFGADGFESYEATGGVVGVDLDRFADAVGMGESDSLVQLELDETDHVLKIEVDGMEYELGLIDTDSIREEPNLAELDHAGSATITGKQLDRLVSACDLVSDHIAFGFDVDKGVLYAEAEGDIDDVHVELDGEEDLLDGQFSESCETLLSVDYMKDLKKTISSDAEVELGIGDELPMSLKYEFADGEGVVKNMVAPRIPE